MASQFTQIVGEALTYEQDVVGDTISSADWTVVPTGPSLTNSAITATAATVLFESDSVGFFVLEVTLALASGQIAVGQARINVLQQDV